MSLIRYSGNEYVPTSFSSLIDGLFNETLTRSGGSAFVPKVDIIENETSYEVHVAAPGLAKEDFNIEVEDNKLIIRGERKFNNEKKDKNYHSIETSYGSFNRAFNLPKDADSSKINAKYNNGILELIVPKDEKKALKTIVKIS